MIILSSKIKNLTHSLYSCTQRTQQDHEIQLLGLPPLVLQLVRKHLQLVLGQSLDLTVHIRVLGDHGPEPEGANILRLAQRKLATILLAHVADFLDAEIAEGVGELEIQLAPRALRFVTDAG